MTEIQKPIEPPSETIRVLAESLLIPAIRIAREAAAENASDPKIAKIFSDRANELEKEAREAGATLVNDKSSSKGS